MGRAVRLLFLGLLLLPAACTSVLPKRALQGVDRQLRFAQIAADPGAYQGRTLLLGGLIVDNRGAAGGSTLEVLRYRLDRWQEPTRVDPERRRFLVHSGRFLDPALYAPGLFITLTGTVIGSRTLPLAGRPYRYPVFRLGAVHVWPRRPEPPRHYAWPPYYPYYPDPYWYWGYPGPYFRPYPLWYRDRDPRPKPQGKKLSPAGKP